MWLNSSARLYAEDYALSKLKSDRLLGRQHIVHETVRAVTLDEGRYVPVHWHRGELDSSL